MIAVSSICPHQDHPEYRANQIRAKESWKPVFGAIYYFYNAEPELQCPITVFIPSERWPRIVDLVRFATGQTSPVAIINADIVLAPKAARLPAAMKSRGVVAATSRRYDLEDGKLNPTDKGRDIFVAYPWVWAQVLREIPDYLRMGHQQWDGWMIAFLRRTYGRRFGDFTPCRFVFHPKHEGRIMPYNEEIASRKPQTSYWRGQPDTLIRL